MCSWLDFAPAIFASALANHSTEWWLTAFTAALVFVTAVLVFMAFLQLLAMKRQERWMRASVEVAEKSANAAKESADAAKESADATAASVKQMKENARKQLRSRVFVAEARKLSDSGGTFQAELVIKNFGHIPAYGCTCTAALILRPNPSSSDALPQPTVDGLAPRIVLPPNGELRILKSLPQGTFEVLQQRQLIAGTHAVYFYGVIRYRDGFARKRHSEFRLRCTQIDYQLCRFSFCEAGNVAN